MTAAEQYFWTAWSAGGKVVELDRVESMELLAVKKVGRIGFLGEDGPVVLPMNYLLADGHIVVRTAAFGIVARSALDHKVAFQVDDVDDFLEAGWSVLVTGPATIVSDAQMQALRFGGSPDPWAEGPKPLFLSIACDRVTGRRLLPR